MADFDTLRAATATHPPRVGLVLGSGMSGGLPGLTERLSVPFSAVPGMAEPSVAGHAGRLVYGDLGGRPVLVFRGRVHFYEGHDWDAVARPMHVLADLGVRSVLLTNAAGGIRPDLVPGRLMALTAHRRWNLPHFWRREPRSSPYGDRPRAVLREAAADLGENLAEGVYASLTGPCYETFAEIRALRADGCDAVGMSTAREAEVAVGLGLEVAAVSLITNAAAGVTGQPLSHHEVLDVAAAAAGRLAALLARWAARV